MSKIWICPRVSGYILCLSVCCLMPALLLYFLGYQARANWDAGSLKTNCTVISENVYDHTCSYYCNSGYSYTCYYTCYDGRLCVTFLTYKGEFIEASVVAYANQNNQFNVLEDLKENYPINGTTTCYYEYNNPTSVQLTRESTTIFTVFFIIFVVLGFLGLFLFIGLEVFLNAKRLCENSI